MLAVAHPWGLGVCLFPYIPLPSSFAVSRQFSQPILAATFMPPRGRPTLVVPLSPAPSSEVRGDMNAFCCARDDKF